MTDWRHEAEGETWKTVAGLVGVALLVVFVAAASAWAAYSLVLYLVTR
jgi:hypothetical protein